MVYEVSMICYLYKLIKRDLNEDKVWHVFISMGRLFQNFADLMKYEFLKQLDYVL